MLLTILYVRPNKIILLFETFLNLLPVRILLVASSCCYCYYTILYAESTANITIIFKYLKLILFERGPVYYMYEPTKLLLFPEIREQFLPGAQL